MYCGLEAVKEHGSDGPRWLVPWKDSTKKPVIYHCVTRVVNKGILGYEPANSEVHEKLTLIAGGAMAEVWRMREIPDGWHPTATNPERRGIQRRPETTTLAR